MSGIIERIKVVEEVIAAYGGVSATQVKLGYKHPMAVYNWRVRGLPQKLIADIYQHTKIPIERLKMGVKEKAA